MTFAGESVYAPLTDGVLEGDFIIESEPQVGLERMIPVSTVLDALGAKP